MGYFPERGFHSVGKGSRPRRVWLEYTVSYPLER
jgi:hypothetical protein